MNTANTKMVMSVLQMALPLVAAFYVINKVKGGITSVFKSSEPTKRELFEKSNVKSNVGGVALMSKNIGLDYQLDSTSYEGYRALHPDNAKILDIILDPMRRVKSEFIVYIDNTIIDKQLLQELGKWH